MYATFTRLLRTERIRLVILSGSMAVWFLMILAIVRSAANDVQAKTQMFDSAMTRGFGLTSLVTPDAMLAQMVGINFNHPLVLALVGAVTVSLGARACQGELDKGTLEATLAHPISRTRYLLGYIALIIAGVALLMGVAWVSMVGFELWLDVPGTLDAGRAAMMSVNAGVVFTTFGAIALLASVVFARGASASFVSLGVLVAMYALTFAERAWPRDWLQQLGQISVFHWYNPGATLLGVEVSATDLIVPAIFSIACFTLAIWLFERRDL